MLEPQKVSDGRFGTAQPGAEERAVSMVASSSRSTVTLSSKSHR